jgi:hypothetical protein
MERNHGTVTFSGTISLKRKKLFGIFPRRNIEVEFEAEADFTASTWRESRGEHFGTPCSEDMGEVEFDSPTVISAVDEKNKEIEITAEIEKLVSDWMDDNYDEIAEQAWGIVS